MFKSPKLDRNLFAFATSNVQRLSESYESFRSLNKEDLKYSNAFPKSESEKDAERVQIYSQDTRYKTVNKRKGMEITGTIHSDGTDEHNHQTEKYHGIENGSGFENQHKAGPLSQTLFHDTDDFSTVDYDISQKTKSLNVPSTITKALATKNNSIIPATSHLTLAYASSSIPRTIDMIPPGKFESLPYQTKTSECYEISSTNAKRSEGTNRYAQKIEKESIGNTSSNSKNEKKSERSKKFLQEKKSNRTASNNDKKHSNRYTLGTECRNEQPKHCTQDDLGNDENLPSQKMKDEERDDADNYRNKSPPNLTLPEQGGNEDSVKGVIPSGYWGDSVFSCFWPDGELK